LIIFKIAALRKIYLLYFFCACLTFCQSTVFTQNLYRLLALA